MKITAIILASGFSKRFKGNKLLALYEEKPLIMHVIDKVIRQDFYEVIIVSQYDEILSLVSSARSIKGIIKFIKNNNPQRGISESIKLGVKVSQPCDAYMFFVGDAPLIGGETIENMIGMYKTLEAKETAILCPVYEGERGNPVIFAKTYKEELMGLSGDEGGKQLIARHKERVIGYEIDHHKELFDIDTQLDFNQLLQMNQID
ncbi:hypothetical protein CS063_04950 [Sporanaerobium hydrogeniformans]|uniref:Uncharacterized protein n=1 Tax=Sporanaerobium hydrogeniformans TaxID=3072179 RepID=A0AC61DDJ6_9FIRM|nr:nucleotidyltransferase family protein [Sporanaerobium hydrogeniformans]PHV71399.1 hypothetical protein CS063_04950 [Sporanaerobium hydrogeniformans]